MALEVTRDNGFMICSFDGELSFDVVQSVGAELDEYLEESPEVLIVDLSNATYLDSTGISLLMRCHAHMKREGRNCVIAGAKGPIERVIKIMKLDTVFTMTPSVEEAKAAARG